LKADATLTGTRKRADGAATPLVKRASFWSICLATAAGLMLAFGLGT
jgi:hypothetical protein